MVLQETFGEFTSTERLRSLIRLICQLPGTYEVLIQTGEGEEGILHCANDTIRNAACRNLSGIEALSVILSWPRGKYWLEELPVLPIRSINLPLERIFTEVEKNNPEARVTPDKTTDKTKGASTEPQFEARGAPAAVKEGIPLEPAKEAVETGTEPETKPAPEAEEKPTLEKKPEPKPTPTTATQKPPIEADDLTNRIAAIKGTDGVIVTSADGILLASIGIEPTTDQIQMVALLGETLEQIGEQFGKGKFKHGSIDLGAQSILLHTFRQAYYGTFIKPGTSAAVVGGRIEDLMAKESEK
ncbi:hypothetical protein JXM67_14365 [candidate division WOR-3 bacterium]|nr:hypothetical protein [candidate division WOR-3 bacterium]